MEPSATTGAGGTLTVDQFVNELKAKLDAVEVGEDGQEIPASTSMPLSDLDADLARLLDGDPGSPPSPPPDAEVQGGSGDSEPAPALPWRWSEDLVSTTPDAVEWVWEDYLAPGTKAIFAGLPKGGKTTAVVALIEASAAEAGSFLGRRIAGGSVVVVSEEGDQTLAPKLRGMPSERVRVLNRDSAWPKPDWPELIAAATEEAKRIGARLLVIDSLAFWAGFEAEKEKDPGAAQEIMDALDQACRVGLAVLLIHHQRKAPGENGTGVRGSGALAGAVDVVIEYERLGDGAPRSQRRLVALSRWPQTPDVLVVDYRREEGSWRVVGEAEGRAGSESLGVRERLLQAVSSDPVTEAHLVEATGIDKRKLGGPLRELVEEDLINREGAGKRGDPFTYSEGVPESCTEGVPPRTQTPVSVSVPPVRETETKPSVREKGVSGTGHKPVDDCRLATAEEEAGLERIAEKLGVAA